ncbi:MAG: dihydroorotase [Gammaproteobacteria bacterium]|nr:dihydroorotase [Gammaproteobacteria bacterium]MYF01955.1 dihydroorotase [Gammaproteobacteria bacterium]MYI78223.1 dihydroorotase [Gammaproteobacteria bacterium]
MRNTIVLKNAKIVNEGHILDGDLAICKDRISQVGGTAAGTAEIDVAGSWVLPGMIDDQVHFREPGMEHKATIATESRAALVGGITSYMEMPNCIPQTTTHENLLAKHNRASRTSVANYGFYLGATNDNLEEIKRVDPQLACGVKVFMGASTGNMLVDNPRSLENIFASCPLVIATHCEDSPTIQKNESEARRQYAGNPPPELHAEIRSDEACFLSSSLAVGLAKKHDARLHVLHLTTAREMELFEIGRIESKKITAEVCVHHLIFDASHYSSKGASIKCNPSVKYEQDREALRQAVNENRIDIIATDHAPHTLEEKHSVKFVDAPAGLPLVEYAVPALLELVTEGTFGLTTVVEKIAHAPAKRFELKDRGFLREGFFADLIVVNPNGNTSVAARPVWSKCGWTPFDDCKFSNEITHTIVNGNLMYATGEICSGQPGLPLTYNRPT